ncbi:YitT family protein [Carboxylicivirga sp. N1Y90]|uniref:YitT family protein n=1 Tax=Carboxylicivirga fragile TaxID=3417571 RepID=UPI003D340422|nr:YitT family protein [Marinilabiliaceae bacterium N1Y90]
MKELKSYIIITLGLLISSIGWTGFIIPSDIVGGGVMGLSSLIYFITDLPVGPTNLVINAILIAISMKVLGKGFGFKTIFSLIVLSLFLTVFQYIITEPIVKEKFMAAIIGGGLVGISIGILFVQGGSTGGTEIVAMLINRKRNVSPGKVMLVCDILIITSSFIVFKSLETMVYGFVVIGLMSYVADMVLTGAQQSVQIFIISKKPNEVAEKISSQINRGLSFLNGRGYHNKDQREFIVMVVRKSESHLIFQIIKDTDPEAFVTVANVMAVYGEGFDQYKPPISASKKKKQNPLT